MIIRVIFGRHSIKVAGLFQHCKTWRNAQSTLWGHMAILFQEHILYLGRGLHQWGGTSFSEEDCEQLNAPLALEELAQCIKSAKCGEAADLDGMTLEAVKLLLHTNSFNILLCVRLFVDNCHKEVPGQMEVDKLLPIPKWYDTLSAICVVYMDLSSLFMLARNHLFLCINSGTNCDLHRGIAGSNVFGKVGDKSRNRRFSDM